MTVNNRTSASFEQPAGGLSTAELDRHGEADLLFDRTHVPLAGRPGAGLGPHFVASSCIACHVRNGRGRAIPGESLVRLNPQAGLGPQVQDKAVLGAEPEAAVTIRWQQLRPLSGVSLRRPDVTLRRADGEPVPPRKPARCGWPRRWLGLGCWKRCPTARSKPWRIQRTPMAMASPGVCIGFPDAEGRRRLGRFGWKALTASVRDQSAAAYREDMGLTTPASRDTDLDPEGIPADISNHELTLVTFYTQTLGAPRTGQGAGSSVVRRASSCSRSCTAAAAMCRACAPAPRRMRWCRHSGSDHLALHRSAAARHGPGPR